MRWKVQVALLMIINKKHQAYKRVVDLGGGMSGNVWKSISRHFQTHFVSEKYFSIFLNNFWSVDLLELSKIDSETEAQGF